MARFFLSVLLGFQLVSLNGKIQGKDKVYFTILMKSEMYEIGNLFS